MSKHFYKDVKVIKFCKARGCNVEFRPERGSIEDRLGFCIVHRREHYKAWYRDVCLPYAKTLTPDQRKRYAKTRHETWKKWVIKNLEKRRKQALESYHRNKAKHKDRKHRKIIL